MQIMITNCRYSPKWDTLEQLIREVTNDENGKITRISRIDRGCDYRKPGQYQLDFCRNDTVLPIQLNVITQK